MQYITTEIILLTSGVLYAAIIIIVVAIMSKKIRKLRKQLFDQFPEQSIETVKEILQRMSDKLTPGDFMLLMQQANSSPGIKDMGEFDYMKNLNRVIFVKHEQPISKLI